MMFLDRIDAGHQLAHALHEHKGHNPLVLAIPRGAVPMAQVIADELQGQLDVVLVRKIGAPFNPEFAVGAVDESGWIYRNPQLGDDPALRQHIEQQRQVELDVMRRRRRQYTPGRAPVDPRGRTVIVVDDGLATGSTMIAALHALRQHQPARLICAIPVAPSDVAQRIGAYADEVVCLHRADDFHAVGQFYRHFDQVDDEEVVAVLAGRSDLPVGEVSMALDDVTLEGEFHPGDGRRLVVFAHGSGSSRHSPRNRYVARVLNEAGIGTLLFDMLTVEEDQDRANRFDIDLLTRRLLGVTGWLRARWPVLVLGYFGASTGAAAALRAAGQAQPTVAAVVSRGGRPDLAGSSMLGRVACPTLLIVGDRDTDVLALNQQAQQQMVSTKAELLQIPGATHLFEETGTLEQVAEAARDWFAQHLGRRHG